MNKLCIVFDLDDTLYKEIDFLESGYRFIAEHVLPVNPDKAYEIMRRAYARGENTFEALNKALNLQFPIDQYLEWYRFHKPSIALDEEVRETLQAFKDAGAILGIITDGRCKTQRNKIEVLGLYDFIKSDDIIISEAFGSEKPDERNYRYFMDKYPGCNYVYVGDNPKKDFIAPNKLGWTTVMLLDDGRNVHKEQYETLARKCHPHYAFKNFIGFTSVIIPEIHRRASLKKKAMMMHFPVGDIMDAVLQLFEAGIRSSDYPNPTDDGLSNALRFETSDAIVTQPADIDGSNRITIYDNYCEFLWVLNYRLLVSNDCSQIISGLQSSNMVSTHRAEELLQESESFFAEALKMLIPGKDGMMFCSRGSLMRSPNPPKNNEFTAFTNDLTVYGLTHVLLHEYSHFKFGHEESTPKNEFEADDNALAVLLNMYEDEEWEKSVFMGVMTSLIASAYIQPTLVGLTHPDLDMRIKNLLTHIRHKSNSGDDSSIYCILSKGIEEWSDYNNMNLPKRETTESFKAYVCRIKPLVEAYKRQFKI